MNMALQNFAHGATHYCKFKRTALCENDLHYDNKITINKHILCGFQKFFFQRSKNGNTPFYLQMFCALSGRSLSWNTPVFSRFTPREHANLIGCHFFHTHVLPHHSKVQLLRYCGKRSSLGIAKSWQVTLDRVPWFGRHVENLGDVIIYPVLGVARTGNGKKGTSGRKLILGLLLPRLLVLFSNAHNGYKHWFACFVAKKSKIDHLWTSAYGITERLWSFYFGGIMYSMEGIYRGVAQRLKMKWATIQVMKLDRTVKGCLTLGKIMAEHFQLFIVT